METAEDVIRELRAFGAMDLYIATRLAFLDLPNVRISIRRERERDGYQMMARAPDWWMAQNVDSYTLFSAGPEGMEILARQFRRAWRRGFV